MLNIVYSFWPHFTDIYKWFKKFKTLLSAIMVGAIAPT